MGHPPKQKRVGTRLPKLVLLVSLLAVGGGWEA